MPGRLIIAFLLLAVTSVVTPCAAQFQWPFGKKKNNSAATGSTASEFPSGPPVRSTAPERPPATGRADPYFTQPHPALSSTFPKKENPISAAWKKATQSVGDALTIKPKVVPAADPTHLSTKPGPIGPDLYLKAAQLMESRGQAEAAVVQYEKALAIDGNHLPSLLGLGRLYHREGRMDDAIRTCLRATQAHPRSAIAYNDLGLCYSRQSRVQSATRALATAVELEPESKLYRNNLAAALVQAGRNEEALMHWSYVHGTAVSHYNLGYLLYKQGKKDAAREQFKLALSEDPQLRQAAQMLGRLKPQPPVVRSNQLPEVMHAPPPTPAPTQPPVANQVLPPSPPAASPPAPTTPAPAPTAPAPAPAAPAHAPSVTAPAPTSLPPVVRPEDYRASRFSGRPVPDAAPQGTFPTPPTEQTPVSDPLIDGSSRLENTITPPAEPAPVVQPPPIVQPEDYRSRSFPGRQVSPTPSPFGSLQDLRESREHLAPILTPEDAAARRVPPSPLAADAEAEPSHSDSRMMPALEQPASPSGVVRPRTTPTDAPQTSERDSPFSLGRPPAAGYEPFSAQREPLPVFASESSDDPDTGNEPEPSGLIKSVEPPAAAHEPFSFQRDPPVKYLPRPLSSADPPPRGEEQPPTSVDTAQPPALLRHRPTVSESAGQQDRGYVRLKPQEAPPTRQPSSMPRTGPILRLPEVDPDENNVGRPVPPPLPPEQDARFLPSTTLRPRELYPVR